MFCDNTWRINMCTIVMSGPVISCQIRIVWSFMILKGKKSYNLLIINILHFAYQKYGQNKEQGVHIKNVKCFLGKCQDCNVPSKVIVHLISWQKATISVRWINKIFSVSHSAADIRDYCAVQTNPSSFIIFC